VFAKPVSREGHFVKLVKESTQLFQGFNSVKVFLWFFALLCLISRFFCISVLGFTRKDFGERYYSWINLFFGYTIVANFAFLGNVVTVASGHHFSWLMLFFWLAFIAVSIYHRREISAKNKAGVEWHSQYQGQSLLPPAWGMERILKALEPALVFLAGLLLIKFSGPAGVWLMASGLALLVNNHLVAYFEREKILDARDAGIEARNMGKALRGLPPQQTGGFVISASNIETVRNDADLRTLFENLSPDIKKLFDDAADGGGVAA
jgi:hypothetical protein